MDYANYHFTLYKSTLIIYSRIDGQIRFRPPIGEHKKDVFDEVIALAQQQESDFPLGVISSDTKKWMEKNYEKIKFNEHRKYFDYVYLASELAELSGSSYSKIRNRLNKFKRNYEYSTEKISEENMGEVEKFLHRWCLWKDCKSDELLLSEKKAILYSISNFFELGLSGIVIRIDGDIEAISVYEPMGTDVAIVHYEKGSPDYDGIYKVINQETAEILKGDFKYINRESDMGIAGLRKAKKSYQPDHMVQVYHISKEDLLI